MQYNFLRVIQCIFARLHYKYYIITYTNTVQVDIVDWTLAVKK